MNKIIYLLLSSLIFTSCYTESSASPSTEDVNYSPQSPKINTISLPEVPCTKGRDLSCFEEESFMEYTEDETEGPSEEP